jgi:hypothetical protein
VGQYIDEIVYNRLEQLIEKLHVARGSQTANGDASSYRERQKWKNQFLMMEKNLSRILVKNKENLRCIMALKIFSDVTLYSANFFASPLKC